jgi:hypothetical protein
VIRPDRYKQALHALQFILVRARWLSTQPEKERELFDLLDWAEHIPWLIAKDGDETQTLRRILVELSTQLRYRFDEPFERETPPDGW